MYTLEELDAIVEKAVITLDLKGKPEELYEPIEYLISIGGKRLRPKMALMTYNLFSDKIDNEILYPAMAIEVFHGFTLIHDDIMDDAPLRRNQTTVHNKWNNNIAILSGDVMCIKSYQYIAHAPAASLNKVLALFSKTAAQVCEGQQIDMNYESVPFITTEDYTEMISLKTAVLIACSAKIGAIIAGAGEKVSDMLYNYGYKLGLAFQIKDDYLDSFGNTLTFGKAIGGDILCNKKTWLLVEAFKRANPEQTNALLALFRNSTIAPEEKITGVLEKYKELGIKEGAEEAIARYHSEARDIVLASGLTKAQEAQLIAFADKLINREK
ncbi:MAG: polyprenyl synthetase family protein [Bacteroidales bacterium]|nr:polyprenyl synthetase family protein [Bacteroidales bacterium]